MLLPQSACLSDETGKVLFPMARAPHVGLDLPSEALVQVSLQPKGKAKKFGSSVIAFISQYHQDTVERLATLETQVGSAVKFQ